MPSSVADASLQPRIMFFLNYRFKHTCNDDNDIGRRRKQQKL